MPENKKILIVDDDQDTLKITAAKLKNSGYAVITANTGKKALEHAAKDKPELIVLDLGLPDIDGVEVCKQLKENNNTRGIPIMIFTSRTTGEFPKGDSAAHIEGFFLKTQGFPGFLDAVNALLA